MKRFQIINYSAEALEFSLMLPGSFLTTTPEQGSVPAKSSCIVCVSPSSKLQASSSAQQVLPWSGRMLVVTDTEQKVSCMRAAALSRCCTGADACWSSQTRSRR